MINWIKKTLRPQKQKQSKFTVSKAVVEIKSLKNTLDSLFFALTEEKRDVLKSNPQVYEFMNNTEFALTSLISALGPVKEQELRDMIAKELKEANSNG